MNLDAIQNLVEKTKAKKVDIELLTNNGMIGKNDLVKVLGRGEIKAKVEITAHGFSEAAIKAIEEAGGKAIKM